MHSPVLYIINIRLCVSRLLFTHSSLRCYEWVSCAVCYYTHDIRQVVNVAIDVWIVQARISAPMCMLYGCTYTEMCMIVYIYCYVQPYSRFIPCIASSTQARARDMSSQGFLCELHAYKWICVLLQWKTKMKVSEVNNLKCSSALFSFPFVSPIFFSSTHRLLVFAILHHVTRIHQPETIRFHGRLSVWE